MKTDYGKVPKSKTHVAVTEKVIIIKTEKKGKKWKVERVRLSDNHMDAYCSVTYKCICVKFSDRKNDGEYSLPRFGHDDIYIF